MLSKLFIKNFILIEEQELSFEDKKLTIITGETGSGKSILLEALDFLLGKRIDKKIFLDEEKKCILEGVFNFSKNNFIKSKFTELDWEFEEETTIRREIFPSGKSRIFINDSLIQQAELLKNKSIFIVIQSQDSESQITKNFFQKESLDTYAGSLNLVTEFNFKLKNFQDLSKKLTELEKQKEKNEKEEDYDKFLLQELVEFNLQKNEQKELEEEFETLSNAENVIESLQKSTIYLEDENQGILSQIQLLKSELESQSNINKINSFLEAIENINDNFYELYQEISSYLEGIEVNPTHLEFVGERLSTLYGLQKKHGVNSEEELFEITEKLRAKTGKSEDLLDEINETAKTLIKTEIELKQLAKKIREKRVLSKPIFEKEISKIVKEMNMPNAKLDIQISELEGFTNGGMDNIEFLFTSNKGKEVEVIKKAASGGEKSRILFALRYVLRNKMNLETIIFDEIDTGVSGKVAAQMGILMKEIAKNSQIISITHSPQIAAKGDFHLKVFKEDKDSVTTSHITSLNQENRIKELASMLSNEETSKEALAQAEFLLKG